MKNDQTRETIHEGAVLIKDGTLLPEALQIESEPGVPGWRLVKDLNGYGLERKVEAAGWTFFWLAGEIGTIALGTDEPSMLRRAIKRILADPRSKPFNTLEITRVAYKRFLGLPYINVGAQARHIQEAMVLSSAGCTQKLGQTESTPTRAKAWGLTSAEALAPERTNAQVRVATNQSP